MDQNKNNRDIESFFRDKFQDVNSSTQPTRWDEPDAEVWSNIEERINTPKKDRRLIAWPWMALGFLLFIGGYFITHDFSNTTDHNIQTTVSKSLNTQKQFTEDKKTNLSGQNSTTDLKENISSLSSQNFTSASEKPSGFADEVLAITQPTHLNNSHNVTSLSDANNVNGTQIDNHNNYLHSDSEDFSTEHKSPTYKNTKSIVNLETTSNYSNPIVSVVLPLETKRIKSINQSILNETEINKFYPVIPLTKIKPNGLSVNVTFGFANSLLKNRDPYMSSEVFRGIDDISDWASSFSISVSKQISKNLSLFGGARYGQYSFQTAYYLSLPFDMNSERMDGSGLRVSDFSHSFPSPIGNVDANYGLARIPEDLIAENELIDFDLFAKHQVSILDFPLGVSHDIGIGERLKLTTQLGINPSIVLSAKSSASTFVSHHSAIHKSYTEINQSDNSYNDIFLSGLTGLQLNYHLTGKLNGYIGAGYEFGLTPVFAQNDIRGFARIVRFNAGVSYQLK